MLKKLSEFRELTENFGQSVMTLKRSIKQKESVRFKTIQRFSISAYDFLYAFDVAAEHSIYLVDINNQWLEDKKLDSNAEIRPKYFETRRLELLYKALFYFLRVYQDEANRLLLELHGLQSGPNSTMSNSLKSEENPINLLLTKSFPEYKNWFYDMRDRRNKIKSYGDFDSVFRENDVQIRFTVIGEENEDLNKRNTNLNVTPIFFGEYFKDSILKCTKLNELIFNFYVNSKLTL